MPFDPDAYLSNQPSATFDPDAYLAGGAPPLTIRSGEPRATTDAIPQGRSGRMREAFTRPADISNVPEQTLPELGGRYKDISVGAGQGFLAAGPGLPGDVASLVGRIPGLPEGVRSAMVENPFQSADMANYMFGEAATPDVRTGRTLGGVGAGFAAPGLGMVKNALAAKNYPLAAKGINAAQFALDPISPMVAGAINAGARGAKAVGSIGRAAEEATPTTNALFDSAVGKYGVMDQSNLAISPNVLQSAVVDIKQSLESSRYLERFDFVAKDFLAGLDELAKTPQSLTQLDALRGKARDLAMKADGGERKVLSSISRKLDETLKNIDETKVVPKDPSLPSADPKTVREKFLEARDEFSRASKSRDIEKLINDAVVNSEGKSLTSVKALQTQFSKLARDEDLLAQYSAAEQKVIRDIAAGNIGANTLRSLENLMPGFSRSSMFGNLMAGLSGTIGASVAGPYGALAFSIPGTIGKAAETARSAKAVPFANQFAEGIRAGNVGNAMAPSFTSPAAVRNLLRPGVGAYGALNNQ